MRLIQFQNPYIRTMLFGEGEYEPLHFERNRLADDYYVKLVFLTRRDKLLLRLCLAHLVTCRLEDE